MTTPKKTTASSKNEQWSKRKGIMGKKNRKERHGRITTQRADCEEYMKADESNKGVQRNEYSEMLADRPVAGI
jgi:hypothetical protein